MIYLMIIHAHFRDILLLLVTSVILYFIGSYFFLCQ